MRILLYRVRALCQNIAKNYPANALKNCTPRLLVKRTLAIAIIALLAAVYGCDCETLELLIQAIL